MAGQFSAFSRICPRQAMQFKLGEKAGGGIRDSIEKK